MGMFCVSGLRVQKGTCTKYGNLSFQDSDAIVFPRNKGRFAMLDGKEIYPPKK